MFGSLGYGRKKTDQFAAFFTNFNNKLNWKKIIDKICHFDRKSLTMITCSWNLWSNLILLTVDCFGDFFWLWYGILDQNNKHNYLFQLLNQRAALLKKMKYAFRWGKCECKLIKQGFWQHTIDVPTWNCCKSSSLLLKKLLYFGQRGAIFV